MKIDRMKNKRGQPCAAIHGIHGEEKLRLPARTIRLSLSLSHSVCVCVCGFWDGVWKEVAVGQQGPARSG